MNVNMYRKFIRPLRAGYSYHTHRMPRTRGTHNRVAKSGMRGVEISRIRGAGM